MKICQISDLHWRSLTRHEEYTESFGRLYETLKRRIQPDCIINTGDTYHNKVMNISPEVIERTAWMIKNLADICPLITILGNHDGNLNGLNRMDFVTPIHEAVNHPDAYLYKQSGAYSFPSNAKDASKFALNVYSPFDEDGWGKIKPTSGKINLALFHGSITGARTDLDYSLGAGERDVSFFKGMNYCLLGDIHKSQHLAYRVDRNGVSKPWISYAGDLIQQNYGESETKGFLVWDIRAADDWDVEFVEHENRAPFVTVGWENSVQETLKAIETKRGVRAYIPGSRFRIISSQPVQQVEARQLDAELKQVHGATEVIFKYDLLNRMDTIDTDGKSILKTNLRGNPDALASLYREFMIAHKDAYVLNDIQLAEASVIIKNYLQRLNQEDIDNSVRDSIWTLKRLEFDNIFRYGEGNVIDFENLEGIVGIFGANRLGKSTIIAAIMYALFNTSDRGPLKAAHMINKNKQRCSAKLYFSVAGIDYVVYRETVRNVPKKAPKKTDEDKTITSLTLHRIEKSGDLIEMNSVSRDETDREIRKLVGQPQDFLMTALSNQGGINKFIEEGATQRKAILSRFLDLDVFDKLNVYAKEDFSVLNDKTRKYSNFDWSSAMKRSQEDILEIEKKIDAVQAVVNSSGLSRDELRLWFMQHKDEDKAATIKRYDALKNLTTVQENAIANFLRMEELCDVDWQTLLNSQNQALETKEKYDVSVLQNKLEQLETLKSSISKQKQIFIKEQETLEQQKKSIRRLETVPCGDKYPTCRFIKDSHQDKLALADQQQKVGELEKAYRELEGIAETLIKEKLAESIRIYEAASRTYSETRLKIEANRANQQIRETAIAAARSKLEDLETELKSVSSTVVLNERKEYDKKKILLEALTEDLEARERELRDLFVELGGKNEKLKQLTKEKAACRADLEKIRIYETVQQAFSKNGIPSIVLKAQLPSINMELNKILGNVVDFTVSLETDISSNTMDVYLEDRHSRRIIETSSGMEKTLCSLALRVALINLSSLSRPDILVLDESFSACDEDSLSKLIPFFAILKSYFKTIILISHLPQIKEAADIIIDIIYTDSESLIRVN